MRGGQKMDKRRREAEKLIYGVFNELDPSKKHYEYYKKKFARMSDSQFKSFISRKFPYRFHVRVFKIEPSIDQMNRAAKLLNIPIFERVKLPYLHKDANGTPIQTTYPVLVIYTHLKKMKQFLTKKNSMSINIDMRDNKTGLLISDDKNGKMSDREFEALAVMGMTQTIREFSRPRADSMKSKSAMYQTINTKGYVSLKELPDEPDDSLAKNMLNVYLIGSGLDSNLLNKEGYLPITIRNKQRVTIRK